MLQRNSLAQAVKDEVLAELNQGDYPPAGIRNRFTADPSLLDSIRTDVLAEIEGERKSANTVNRTLVENIKNDLLLELEAARYGRNSNRQNILSDRSIDQRIDRQYRNLGNLRGEIRRGLETAREADRRLERIGDPLVREAVNSIIREARNEGISLDQIITRLDASNPSGPGLRQRMGGWFSSGAGRGFFWGVGVTLAASLLFPATRHGLRNMGVKVMESTMGLADQTRSTFGRAQEGFEDMIAEANYNSLQENQTFAAPPSEEYSPVEEPPSDGEPYH